MLTWLLEDCNFYVTGARFCSSSWIRFFLSVGEKLEKPSTAEPERSSALKQGSSLSSPPAGGQQVCVVLQPPLPSLSNKSSSPTQLGSLADNVRPSSVPIILAPSPALSSLPLASPQGSRSSTPTDPGPKQLEMTEECRAENKSDGAPTKPGQSVSPASTPKPKPKASIHDI